MPESPQSASERDPSVPDHEALDDTTLAAPGRALPASQSHPSRLDQPRVPGTGDKLGRYVVLRQLGTGGMGTVFEAYDAELDRHVALKLLRPGGGGEDLERRRRRLLREAQAMARLSHPNVIAVYDVGTFGDEVFIAMELVRGSDAREWLAESERSWRDVLGVMVAAGRGLEAAHAASLVHRDFKPSNILVSRVDSGPGRVKVLDFGLARAMHDPLSSTGDRSDASEDKQTTSALSATLTRVGDVVGTPVYMSPEQHSGKSADARSDQFAFCVSLYEALYGRRPFRGETLEVLATAIVEGRVAPEPSGRDVPGWLRAACLRGIAAEPELRYESMSELLQDLDRHRRSPLAKFVVPVATMAIGAAGVWAVLRNTEELCTHAQDRLAGIWDDESRVELRNALETAAPRLGVSTATAVESSLDRYSIAWVAEHNEACAATRVREEVSASMMDRRMACLDGRLRRLEALVQVLRAADHEVVELAMTGVRSLPEISPCADLEALAAALPPPSDDVASDVGALRMRLAEARTYRAVGRIGPARSEAAEVVRLAKGLGYAPLLAEAHEEHGSVLESSGDFAAAEAELHEAIWVGEAARHDAAVADARTELAWVVAVELGRAGELEDLVRGAEAAATRAGDSAKWQPAILNVTATVRERQGEYEETLKLRQRILALTVEREEESLSVSNAHFNVGSLQLLLGKYEEALVSFERANEIAVDLIGPTHPATASLRQGVATAYIFLGRNEDAVVEYEGVLEARLASLGPKHPDVATTLNNLGAALAGLDRYDEARERYDRALAIRRELEGAEGLSVASTEQNISDLLMLTGKAAEALPLAEHAVKIRRRHLGDEHPKVGESIRTVGRTLRALGRHDEAHKSFSEAAAIYEKTLAADHPKRVELLVDLEEAEARISGPP